MHRRKKWNVLCVRLTISRLSVIVSFAAGTAPPSLTPLWLAALARSCAREWDGQVQIGALSRVFRPKKRLNFPPGWTCPSREVRGRSHGRWSLESRLVSIFYTRLEEFSVTALWCNKISTLATLWRWLQIRQQVPGFSWCCCCFKPSLCYSSLKYCAWGSVILLKHAHSTQ